MVKEKAGINNQIPRKNSKRLSMPPSWREILSLVGFRFHCPSIFKGGRPDLENSKLVKALTVLKVASRNPGHSAGAHWHRYM